MKHNACDTITPERLLPGRRKAYMLRRNRQLLHARGSSEEKKMPTTGWREGGGGSRERKQKNENLTQVANMGLPCRLRNRFWEPCHTLSGPLPTVGIVGVASVGIVDVALPPSNNSTSDEQKNNWNSRASRIDTLPPDL